MSLHVLQHIDANKRWRMRIRIVEHMFYLVEMRSLNSFPEFTRSGQVKAFQGVGQCLRITSGLRRSFVRSRFLHQGA